jgi:hypothetical protein
LLPELRAIASEPVPQPMSITVDGAGGASGASSTAPRNARSRIVSATTGVIDAAEHASQLEPIAVAVARAHVDAWGEHDYDVARAALASDVHVVVTSVDPDAPRVDTIGIEEYMDGLAQFGQAVVPGSTSHPPRGQQPRPSGDRAARYRLTINP